MLEGQLVAVDINRHGTAVGTTLVAIPVVILRVGVDIGGVECVCIVEVDHRIDDLQTGLLLPIQNALILFGGDTLYRAETYLVVGVHAQLVAVAGDIHAVYLGGIVVVVQLLLDGVEFAGEHFVPIVLAVKVGVQSTHSNTVEIDIVQRALVLDVGTVPETAARIVHAGNLGAGVLIVAVYLAHLVGRHEGRDDGEQCNDQNDACCHNRRLVALEAAPSVHQIAYGLGVKLDVRQHLVCIDRDKHVWGQMLVLQIILLSHTTSSPPSSPADQGIRRTSQSKC